uniref:F-box/LRR-repeat protein 23 n=3 Tax=Nicotiana TaxID=4085 RepID=A0A1S3ZPD2_TOBAC|nr:PREDICTED: putative F-box/LRR-repeat protein 23 [Nicotiana sylvestris]XP_016466118.1 PREDICTED: putative F-box/LRR-repeat protein 23 [Nicotiana tabacum]
MLEELSLTHTDITIEGIEALGRSCPRLKSFELNSIYCKEDGKDDEALAIAKNLPTLHHLRLIGNSMTKEGLQAILDGCPNLVSLDLRLCYDLTLLIALISGRFSRQIKHVKNPFDSLEGFKYAFAYAYP